MRASGSWGDVLPHEPADRPRAVDPHHDFAIGGQDISCAVEDLAAIFIEASRQSRHRLEIQTVTHREIDATLFDCLLCVFLRIHGGGHNFDAVIGKLTRLRESGQLPSAVASPVAAIEENDTKTSPECIGKTECASTGALDFKLRKRIARIQYLRAFSWHC